MCQYIWVTVGTLRLLLFLADTWENQKYIRKMDIGRLGGSICEEMAGYYSRCPGAVRPLAARRQASLSWFSL